MVTQYSRGTTANQNLLYFATFLCLIVYTGCLFFPLMDKDAAHHANIALRMVEHNDFINLIDREKDYLDKPHLLFWVSAISFKIFGINTFAHRFPALLFSLVSLYSTFCLAKHLTNRNIAWTAMLILATAQSFMLSISDARMETPLTAFIMFGLWHLVAYIDKNKFYHLALAALGTALAFATKGWLGPVIIFISCFFYLLLSRKWNVFTRWRTWLFIPLFFIFISPVLYAYYIQFDLHPEKVIRGQDGRSGIHFILWDQLFERAQGFDVEKRNSSYFFLYHTFLWAFFPWSIIAYTVLILWMRRWVNKKWKHPLGFAAMSFYFILFAISFSKFKMPHYIIMLLPLAALYTAPYISVVFTYVKSQRIFYAMHMLFAILVLVVTGVLNLYFFPLQNVFLWIIGLLSIAGFLFILQLKFTGKGIKIWWISIALSVLFNFFLNYNFFPGVMKYQAGNELVKQIDKKNLRIQDSDIMLVELHAHSFDFYRKKNHNTIDAEKFASQYPIIKNKYFLVSPFLANFLRNKGFTLQTIVSQVDYNVSTLKFKFLNPATRNSSFDSLMLVKILPANGVTPVDHQ